MKPIVHATIAGLLAGSAYALVVRGGTGAYFGLGLFLVTIAWIKVIEVKP